MENQKTETSSVYQTPESLIVDYEETETENSDEAEAEDEVEDSCGSSTSTDEE